MTKTEKEDELKDKITKILAKPQSKVKELDAYEERQRRLFSKKKTRSNNWEAYKALIDGLENKPDWKTLNKVLTSSDDIPTILRAFDERSGIFREYGRK